MNYQKVYDKLVQKNHVFSSGEYFETHHKVPKCMGGNDEKSNLVNLTAREHYIAHLLLVKITEQNGDKNAHGKMLYAFNCMKWGRCKGKRSFKFNSRLYQKMKHQYSELRSNLMKTNDNPMCGRMWIYSLKLKISKQHDKTLPIPKGWFAGRHTLEWFEKREAKEQENEMKERTQLNKLNLLNEMFLEFKKNEFEGVVKKFGYNHTRNALIMMFKKYIPEYVPQECNRWKNRNK